MTYEFQSSEGEAPQVNWSTAMFRKRRARNGEHAHKPEEIVTKLWQAGVLVGQGMARVEAIREVRIAE